MTRLRRLLPAALLAALMGAPLAAPLPDGPTYRIVGPDGKVTFSDRKPTDPGLHTRELGQTITAPLLTPSSQPFDLRPATTLAPAARAAPGEGLTPAVDVSGKPFPPGLPDAILDVVVHQFFVQTLVETCSRLRPPTPSATRAACATGATATPRSWPGATASRFARFTGEQRDTLRATARSRLAQLVPMAGSADADRMAWCDRMSTDLARRSSSWWATCASRPSSTSSPDTRRGARRPASRMLADFSRGAAALPPSRMSTTESFLLALTIVFSVPYLAWRLGRTDYWAPLVVVQTVGGVLLGPGVLGKAFPDQFHSVFSAPVVQLLGGLATWGVMVFVWIAGIELDLRHAWTHRRESALTAGLALGTPLVLGCGAALVLLSTGGAWSGPLAQPWQFVVGVGMACAVTALPVLILLLDKMAVLRLPIGQRILRYASLDDIAIWAVLALILMDWRRVGTQLAFLAAFGVSALLYRRLMRAIPDADRWFVGVVWLAACAFGADWCGLHFMVGAFLAGAITDAHWFDEAQMDALRRHVLLLLMPVYFVTTGLRTSWGGSAARGRGRRRAAGGEPGRQAGGGAHRGPTARLVAVGVLPHRLAAADQGPDHDHLRQHPAGQADRQQRDLHRPAADGRGQHDADHADRHADAGAPAGAAGEGELIRPGARSHARGSCGRQPRSTRSARASRTTPAARESRAGSRLASL